MQLSAQCTHSSATSNSRIAKATLRLHPPSTLGSAPTPTPVVWQPQLNATKTDACSSDALLKGIHRQPFLLPQWYATPWAPTQVGAWAAREVKKLNAIHKICWLRMSYPEGPGINLPAPGTCAYEWYAEGPPCLRKAKNKFYMWSEWTPNWLALPRVRECVRRRMRKYWYN